MQGNLARPAAVAKAFASDAGGFELVFNCAALTKFGQVTPAWPPFDPHTPALPHALAHTRVCVRACVPACVPACLRVWGRVQGKVALGDGCGSRADMHRDTSQQGIPSAPTCSNLALPGWVQEAAVYEEHVVALSVGCATEAAKQGGPPGC